MLNTEVASLEKHGDTVIRTELFRNLQGLTVNVRAHTSVEEFMRSLGSGEVIDPKVSGHRYWEPIKDTSLLCYDLNASLGPLTTASGQLYTIQRIGYPLLEEDRINISFLRLRGISGVEGVTFKIRGVYPKEQLERIRDCIGMAQDRFFYSFMKPAKMSVEIVTQSLLA